MKESFIPYTHQGVQLEAFVVTPSAKKSPVVILCHAWNGRGEFICEKARMIAQAGYIGFALDIYGKGKIGRSKEENAALKKPFIDDRLLLQQRLLAAYNLATKLPQADPASIAALGFGFRGLCALDLARSGVKLKAAVSVYGHFESSKQIEQKKIATNILILHGYDDPVVPPKDLESFSQEMKEKGAHFQAHLYSDTKHAFANPDANDPASGLLYNAKSAQSAWKQAVYFFDEVFQS
jgi:dienelactone hydrolase